mgnify:CR=1 FL=1
MKHQLKTLAVAVALVAGMGQANAALIDGTGGNGELFFAAYSPSLQTSYVRDLGIRLNNFTPTATTVATAGTYAFNPDQAIGTTAASSVRDSNYSLSFLTDSLLMNSLGNGTSLASDVVWMVGAVDSTGSGANGHRYLTTIGTPQSSLDLARQLNGTLINFGNVNAFVGGQNGLGTMPNTATTANTNGSAIATPGTLPIAAYFPTLPMQNWASQAVFDATGGVGDSLPFYFLTASSTSAGAPASNTKYATAAGTEFTWTLNADGSLTYAAAVPIPAAVWLFGSGLLGLIGITRRRKTLAA